MTKKRIKKTLQKISNASIFDLPRKVIGKIVLSMSEGHLISINNYWIMKGKYDKKMPEIRSLIKRIKSETNFLLNDWEALQIYLGVQKTAKVSGSIAEVGVFMGGSAKLIAHANSSQKKIHLFDTFEGLPSLHKYDNQNQFHSGQFASSFEKVQAYLSSHPEIHFYKGLFPSTATPVESEKFSFIHIDVDLYETTLACLNFFYPRMTKGAILISHDYIWADGVRKAFEEFFADKPEPVIELDFIGSQCLVVKT